MAESEEELKSLLMKVKEESEKAGLIWSHHFMASRWGKMKTVADFIFLGSKITGDGNCSREIKGHLLLGRKAMTNLESLSKSEDIALRTKFLIVKAMVLPAVMYGCES